MSKSVKEMTASEYKEWLYNNPDEAKKLDEATSPKVATPSGLWRNGVWVNLEPKQE